MTWQVLKAQVLVKKYKKMNKEIKIFFTCLMFYTRIPCPSNIDHDPDYINKATRYFPLIGWIVGVLSFLVYFLSSYVLDSSIAIVLSLITGILITGAFHEDGLADVFDGFGGGWTKQKILEIMKDSQVGAFGAISLALIFLLKYTSLHANIEKFNDPLLLLLLFVSYHSLARLTAVSIVFTSEYSREDETSKAKPIAKTHGKTEIISAFFFGLLPLMMLIWFNWKFALVLVPLYFLSFFSKRYFEKWIDGYTGDCLGAVEQLAECVCLISYVVLWKFM